MKKVALKYKQRLQLSQAEKDGQETQFQEEEAKLQLASDILATQQSISKSERQLEALKNIFPLDVKGIIASQDEILLYKEGLKSLKKLQEELF